MNYLSPNGQDFHAEKTEPLFAIDESDYGYNAFDHPRPEIASVGDRLHELSLGIGALALFELNAGELATDDLARY